MALILLSACNSVPIKNATFDGSLGPNGAFEFNLLNTDSKDISLQDWAAAWNDLSNPDGPMVCTRTATLANFKMVIETLCSWHPSECDIQAQNQVSQFMSRVQQIGKHNDPD